jgi:hypothetical protein
MSQPSLSVHRHSSVDDAMLIRGSIYICSNHPLSGTKTSVSALASLTEDDPAKDAHISSSPVRHHLKTDPFVAAKLPATPISPLPSYGHDSPSRNQPLVQNSFSPPPSPVVRKQTSRSAIIADGPGHQRSRTSRSKNVSGTLTQNTGSTSQLSQLHPPSQRQGTGEPSSKSSPLSSRTGTSSHGTRRRLKCRSGEHDFERKFGVSIPTKFVISFWAMPLLNLSARFWLFRLAPLSVR